MKSIPNPNCLDCHGTGRIELFTSIIVCKCSVIGQPKDNNYIDTILEIDLEWADSCCSCHLHPPCGFCTRYANAYIAEPEYCDACGDPSPEDESLLYECSECDKHICVLCCCDPRIICLDCKKA